MYSVFLNIPLRQADNEDAVKLPYAQTAGELFLCWSERRILTRRSKYNQEYRAAGGIRQYIFCISIIPECLCGHDLDTI